MLAEHNELIADKSVLHFAPETQIKKLILDNKPKDYVTADIEPGVGDLVEDMTKLTLDDESYDVIVANHVLEHIPDDAKAFSEVHRILKKGGKFFAAVPMVDGWSVTYENPNVSSEKDRILHFGQHNHVRYYGQDFVTRFENAGFKVSRYQAKPEDCVKLALRFGETIFIGDKI